MTAPSTDWTSAQRRAFSYARMGEKEGLSIAATLRGYRAGGGAIRTRDFYDVSRYAKQISDWSDTIETLPDDYDIREEMHTVVDWDFRERYVLQMEVGGYSKELGMYVRKFVTVESDKLLTRKEWEWGAQQAVDYTIGSPIFTIERIYSFEALVRPGR